MQGSPKKLNWYSSLQHDLAVVREALEHAHGTKASRLGGVSSGIFKKSVLEAAGIPSESTEHLWTPETYRPCVVPPLHMPKTGLPAPQVSLIKRQQPEIVVLLGMRKGSDDISQQKKGKTLLAAQIVPSSRAKKLRVSHLQACDMANVLITSSCHPAEVIFKKEVKGELAVEHVWEDNSNWPPLLKIKLTEMSWKAYQAARQLGKQADENKDDEKKDNEEKAEDEASLAEHVDRSGAPRNAARPQN